MHVYLKSQLSKNCGFDTSIHFLVAVERRLNKSQVHFSSKQRYHTRFMSEIRIQSTVKESNPLSTQNLLLLHLLNLRTNVSERRLCKLECVKRLIKGARAAGGACFDPSRLENWLIIMHQGVNVLNIEETKYGRAIREDQSTNPSSQHLKLIYIPKMGSNSVLLYL